MIEKIIASDRIEFTNQDRQDPTWLKLSGYLQTRLEKLRISNDGPLDAIETAKVRGAIAEIKSILALAKDKPNL